MNFWQVNNLAPVNGADNEVIIKSFQFEKATEDAVVESEVDDAVAKTKITNQDVKKILKTLPLSVRKQMQELTLKLQKKLIRQCENNKKELTLVKCLKNKLKRLE